MTAESAADYRLRQRDYLLAIARAMTSRLDLEAVLGRVIRSAVEMTHGQSGTIAMRQPDGRMRVVASYGLVPEMRLDPASPESGTPRLPAPGAAGPSPGAPGAAEAPRSGPGPLLPAVGTALTEADLRLARRGAAELVGEAADGGPRHMLALPLAVAEEEMGLILVFRSEGAAVFTPLDSELLDAFADQAAVAIHNARLHERLAARERELAAIVHFDPSGVLLLDAAGQVRDCNPALAALAARPEGGFAGQPLAEVLPLADDAGRALAPPLPAADEPTVTRGWLRRPGGERGPFVQVTVTAVPARLGGVDGYVADVVDLSAYKANEEAKGAFLAGLSHELKTPLALIRGYAETLRMPGARQDPELFDDALGVILAETEHLTAMVDELLTAARLQAGGLRLAFDEVDLAGLLTRLVAEFATARPEHRWVVEAPEDLPPVVADPARLREVFLNLLSNAAKYSEPGSRVRVRAAALPGELLVSVADEGIGIAPEDQDRIFERFARATDRAEGAGLGLYMCRAILAAHGGRIGVESVPGKGSVFTVHLPLSQAAPGEPAAGSGAGSGAGPEAGR